MNGTEVVETPNIHRTIASYIDVLKPRETILLTFIGLCAAFIAVNGHPALGTFLLAGLAVLMGSAGANGLTNYLDRNLDAKMRRTCRRSLPAGRINPPEKVLPVTITLVVIGLAIALWLHPLCMVFGLAGVITAVTFRKRVSCAFPQGVVAGLSPVLIGWVAFDATFSAEIVLISLLIAVWIPLHVWSVMLANREDYQSAGIGYFPLSWQTKDAVKVLLTLSFVLIITSLLLSYFASNLSWLYLLAAIVMGILTLGSAIRLTISSNSHDAWKLYKLSSFPYLGIIFMAMCLDIWLL
ncbi:MAG: protoheme IX farnesyltransferase [Chloroflexota bacterium]|nr:protoheme IX farnesyltransferase [Chloroflexota bacterium]